MSDKLPAIEARLLAVSPRRVMLNVAALHKFRFEAPTDIAWLIREVKRLRREVEEGKQCDLLGGNA